MLIHNYDNFFSLLMSGSVFAIPSHVKNRLHHCLPSGTFQHHKHFYDRHCAAAVGKFREQSAVDYMDGGQGIDRAE